jgi:hypothetical protein
MPVGGAALGGLFGWLLIDKNMVRQDPGQGVAVTLIGAVFGVFLAIGVLTKGTWDFKPHRRTHKRGFPPSGSAVAEPSISDTVARSDDGGT